MTLTKDKLCIRQIGTKREFRDYIIRGKFLLRASENH